ncbi:MAG: histidine phosphatase family protein, partial [Chloroflexi bacterium]|nr:histidine phosphatase family protein [Chloroflexota bacterium]
PGESILVVSHKTAILVLLCWALEAPLDRVHRMLQQNAAVNMLQIDGNRRWVGLVNDTSHLPEELVSPAR